MPLGVGNPFVLKRSPMLGTPDRKARTDLKSWARGLAVVMDGRVRRFNEGSKEIAILVLVDRICSDFEQRALGK